MPLLLFYIITRTIIITNYYNIDEAVFLDITHGLYSLALSDPIEWPAFINEYNAWYRSREQWNQIMTDCGFARIDPPSSSGKIIIVCLFVCYCVSVIVYL